VLTIQVNIKVAKH